MKTISRFEYYTSIAYYMIACQAHRVVLEHTKLLTKVFGETSAIVDHVYNTEALGSKDEYDKLLSENGITVEWKEK